MSKSQIERKIKQTSLIHNALLGLLRFKNLPDTDRADINKRIAKRRIELDSLTRMLEWSELTYHYYH